MSSLVTKETIPILSESDPHRIASTKKQNHTDLYGLVHVYFVIQFFCMLAVSVTLRININFSTYPNECKISKTALNNKTRFLLKLVYT